MNAEVVRFEGNGGDGIEGYLARPSVGAPSRGGVIVIHHLPGWDRWSKEVTRRFAVMGYDVIAPHLYSRVGEGVSRDDAAAAARAQGGVTDEQVAGDMAGAAAYLRDLPTSNGKVGVIGYCSGGRHAVLTACNVDVEAAVNCYGGYVTRDVPPASGLWMTSIIDQVPGLRSPMLGLFGNDDVSPSPADVSDLEKVLIANGKTYEFHRYDGAAHAFFCVDRPAYRPEAAVDGWERVEAFFGTYL
jgi:carboxymethylenebutenolidase